MGVFVNFPRLRCQAGVVSPSATCWRLCEDGMESHFCLAAGYAIA